jgi:ubiquinone/menaquinone biosynthesis C-methylase UbiE
MVGLDVSARLLKIAKKRSSQLQVVRGDMRFLPFKPQTFAAAVSMDTSFGYLPSLSDDEISIAEVRRVLFKQGVFVIDVFNREELAHKYAENTQPSKWKEYPSFFLQQKRTTNQNGNWLCDLWTIRDKVSGRVAVFEHVVRLYAKDELEGLLAKAGFSVNQVFGTYEGESFSADSPRLILEAQAE